MPSSRHEPSAPVQPAAAPSAPLDPRALLARQVRACVGELAGARAGDPRAVHRVRVAARRLRLGLLFLAARPTGRRVRRAERSLKRVLRGSSRGRDGQVALALLSALLKHPDAAERRLLARLRGARQRSRHALSSDLALRELRRLRRRLRRVARAGVVDRERACRRLDAWVASRSQELSEDIATLGARLAPRRLHAVRIACRRLRYAGEVLGALTGRQFVAVGALTALQECLGGVQDAQVVVRWLRRQSQRAPAASGARAALRRALVRARNAARAEHERYLHSQPTQVVARACTELRTACAAATGGQA